MLGGYFVVNILGILDWPKWLGFVLLVIVFFFIVMFWGLSSERQIDIEKDYGGISIDRYLLRKVGKRKSIMKKLPIYKQEEIVGEYEYLSILENTEQLLNFYKKCIVELQRIKREEKDKVYLWKVENLENELHQKIHNLQKIVNLRIRLL